MSKIGVRARDGKLISTAGELVYRACRADTWRTTAEIAEGLGRDKGLVTKDLRALYEEGRVERRLMAIDGKAQAIWRRAREQ